MFYLLITASLFYLIALLQVSFFSHFNLLGTTPNILFIAFVMLVFFDTKKNSNYYNVIVWAFCAGIFLDIFSYPYFGASIALLIAIGLFIKKMQSSLKEKDVKYPLSHLLIIFFASFAVFRMINIILLNFNQLFSGGFVFPWGIILEALYSGAIALGIFYIIKRLMPLLNDRKKLQS